MMIKIPAVVMRGGTSKGIFFKKEDLPPEGPERDKVLMKIFGSGDASQIDGLGGGQTHTSKAMIVWKSNISDVDIEYTFGQIGITEKFIDWTGNCGNLTAAVAPFAIDEKLLEAKEPYTLVKLYNTNTKKRIDAIVPVEGGVTKYEGNFWIDGVPNPGSRIDLIWYNPAGSITGKLLPTGNPKDKIYTGMEVIECSIVDASNPAIFVRAKDLGLTGKELPGEINKETELKIERIRSEAAKIMGIVKDAKEATTKSPHFPFIILVAENQDYKTSEGKIIKKKDFHILARVYSMQKMHHAYPVSGTICTGAAARIPGTIVNEFFNGEGRKVIIGHPKGLIDVDVEIAPRGEIADILSVTIARTARRLMSGFAYYIP